LASVDIEVIDRSLGMARALMSVDTRPRPAASSSSPGGGGSDSIRHLYQVWI